MYSYIPILPLQRRRRRSRRRRRRRLWRGHGRIIHLRGKGDADSLDTQLKCLGVRWAVDRTLYSDYWV